jgi:hypothetical protein
VRRTTGEHGGEASEGVAAEVEREQPRARRRFHRRRRATSDLYAHGSESLASLDAEVVLLREENARLKSAPHQPTDIGRLLGRARSLSSSQIDRDGLSDETAQMLVDGLVIRESLMEICQEIERTMVAFGAKLDALAIAAAEREPVQAATHANGHGPTSP